MAYLEPNGSSEASRTCTMIIYIQSPGIVKAVYSSSSIFKDILIYSGILMHIEPHSHAHNLREARRLPLLVLKIENKVS